MSKTFKCPYCDYHGSRQDLVEHIDDEHDEMIPEGFTPVHLVFDIVNGKKDHHGICVVCKRDTEWDENASKYKRLCGRKQCAEALRDIYKKNMLKVHGKITLLDDPEQQEKMLANRSISGKVQFDDKGFHTYTGSYERKLLEFENSIGFKASDILSPGPTIEYDYKGEKHKYITDQMIIPFNLIIEVKDGGGNTNNRINDDSRDRTIAKEIAITKLGKYNYLRLTNNSFDQLLETLAELKAQMVDDSEDNKKVIININEEVEALKEMLTTEESISELYSTDEHAFLDLLYEEVKVGHISKQDWEDIKTIYSSLNAQEKKFIGGVTNSPKVVFCKVYKEGSKPVAFVRGFDFGRDEIIIEVCVASYARGKGYAVRGVNECVAFTKMKKYDKAVYLVNKKNTASIALAKKCGFKLEMTRKDYFVYVIQTSKGIDD